MLYGGCFRASVLTKCRLPIDPASELHGGEKCGNAQQGNGYFGSIRAPLPQALMRLRL
jgi:hypothetical protein